MTVFVESRIDDADVMALLGRLAAKGENLRPVMAAFGDYLIKETVDRFDAQRDPDGVPWAPLSPFTLATKKNDRILTESADLRHSFSRKAGKVSMRMGTDRPYAAAHQWGLKQALAIGSHRRRVKSRDQEGVASGVAFVKAHVRHVDMPERAFLGYTDADKAELTEITKEYLLDR